MGQDIHLKTYVYSKVENKYIDALELTTCPQYSVFRPFFSGRYYDLFSLFGSMRGNYKELSGAYYGTPDFISRTYAAYLDELEYYGFEWFYINDLMKSIDEYIMMLKDPTKYFTEDDIEYEYIQSGEFDADSWIEQSSELSNVLEEIRQNLKRMRDLKDEYPHLEKIIDPSKTVILVYFDS